MSPQIIRNVTSSFVQIEIQNLYSHYSLSPFVNRSYISMKMKGKDENREVYRKINKHPDSIHLLLGRPCETRHRSTSALFSDVW